jgi:ribosomal protein L40E
MKEEQTNTCAGCGGENPTSAGFCITCGAPLSPAATTGPTIQLATAVCRQCGFANPADALFCAGCRNPLSETVAQPQPPAPQPPAPQPPAAPAMPLARLIGQLLMLLAIVAIFTPLRLWPGLLVMIGVGGLLLSQTRLRTEAWLPILFLFAAVALLVIGGSKMLWPAVIILIVLATTVSRRVWKP